jgi:TonB family protein
VLADGDQLRHALGNLARRGFRGRALLQFVVGTDGVPAEVRVERSSGNAELDRLFARLARTLAMYPALLNRVPVKVAVSLPVSTY